MAVAENITIAQIAKAAGVSRATASYCLSGNPKIPAATSARVSAVAQELGYRPNPQIASLMAHIRGGRRVAAGSRIAFVWVHMPKSETSTDPFLQVVFQGARRRAEKLGYGLEEFWIEKQGLRDRRVSKILRARGIVGVVFSPVMHGATVKLDFEWDAFASAVIGHAEWNPELNHAGHHHYHAMRLTLQELGRLGCNRPAVILDAETNDRGRRAWQASFLVFHPVPRTAPSLLMAGLPETKTQLRTWLKRHRPDALILHGSEMIRRFRSMVPAGEQPLLAALHWSPDLQGIGGVNQRFDLVAENAVDLVVSQLRSNERGVPELPRVTLFPGQWIESADIKSK
jgi:LacI family transcriptional regulator